MSLVEKTSWSKILAICGSIGVPLISVAVWLIISGTHLVDKVDAISMKQDKGDARMDLLDLKMDRMNHRIDTLANHQDKEGLFTQRWVNGKLTFVHAR